MAKATAALGIIDQKTPIGRRFEFSNDDGEFGITFGGVRHSKPLIFFDDGRPYSCTGDEPDVDQWNEQFGSMADGYTDGKFDALPDAIQAAAKPKPPAAPAAPPTAPKPAAPAPPPADQPDPPATDDSDEPAPDGQDTPSDAIATEDAQTDAPAEIGPESEAQPVSVSAEAAVALSAARAEVENARRASLKAEASKSLAKAEFDETAKEAKDADVAFENAKDHFVDVYDKVVLKKSGAEGPLFANGNSDADETPKPDAPAEPGEAIEAPADPLQADLPDEIRDARIAIIGGTKGVMPIAPGRIAKLADAGIDTIGDLVSFRSEGVDLDSLAGIGEKAARKILESVDEYIAAVKAE